MFFIRARGAQELPPSSGDWDSASLGCGDSHSLPLAPVCFFKAPNRVTNGLGCLLQYPGRVGPGCVDESDPARQVGLYVRRRQRLTEDLALALSHELVDFSGKLREKQPALYFAFRLICVHTQLPFGLVTWLLGEFYCFT